MEKLTIAEIAKAAGGTYKNDGEILRIVSNSKEVKEGDLFVAVRGERFDGHNFIPDAVQNGCTAILSHEKDKYTNHSEKTIYVDDTKQAILDIAEYYKTKFNVKTIGVTGSVGKTTSKDFIACVMESKYKTLKSVGNENNEIGLPRTVFNMDKSCEAAVFEMGMSNFGEISKLTKVAKPDVGVITNIGECHLEYLKTRENILKAKMEICEGMKDNSPLIICGDNDLLKDVVSDRLKVIKYGIENSECDIKAENILESERETKFDVVIEEKRYTAKIPSIGTHNVLNALAAIAVGIECDINVSESIKALENYQPSGMRQKISEINGVILVEDCYNASPTSVEAAMKTFGTMNNNGRKIAVLGDMLELGDISKEAHRNIGDVLSENGIEEAFTFGKEMRACTARAYELGVQAINYDTKEELITDLLSDIKSGDAIWVKGSRGMKLEEVVEAVHQFLGK